ncbi:AbrB/MazE/SpoVT family DNA-binding domain-containing protein [Candidatus Bathyarchaeota archaeon]|nr:AbrB/MazE/SpoVT family DNA-binding domain-containing protein [Candidatus Bathyarchaeota archaeon]MBS7613585.1 AbrB/MazE/SpoVT family DNA-binding domain-containing protein [Candidatus Bathyarchaeota archaeon]MBS7618829.1 AbrB/MazE/SpoVT family DNA-binding domain-containing protein [Candidatus Bathyarchaeota archaeon]
MEHIVKVTRNYQVTIPAPIREAIGIREGDVVKFIYDEGENLVKIIPPRRKRTTVRIGRKISVEEMEEVVEAYLDEATR